MEKLTDNLYSFIFNYLDIQDLFICRLVSKKWRSFIDQLKPTELIINLNMYFNEWNFTYDTYNSRNSIEIKNLTKLKLFPFNLIELKRLSCNLPIHDDQSIDLFNEYKNLEQLEIRFLRFKLNENNKKQLNLIKLKYLLINIKIDTDDDLKLLKINSLNLKYLAGSNLNFIDFQDLSTLIHLEPDDYDFEDKRLNLSQFKNIKYLILGNIQDVSRDADFKLSILPNLEELRCYAIGLLMDKDYYNVQNFMINLLEERTSLGRLNLKIYFHNVELIDGKPFLNYKFYKLFGLSSKKVYWYYGLLETDDEDVSESDFTIETNSDLEKEADNDSDALTIENSD